VGWWSDRTSGEVVVGDEPLDLVGAMLDRVLAVYKTDLRRKPTVQELERLLEIALLTRLDELFEGMDELEISSVSLKLKKRPKRQPIAVGDYFSVPLPSGGYGFGRVKGIYLTSVLLVEFLQAYSETPMSVSELRNRRPLFEGLCGYLGLAEWHWRVLGNIPVRNVVPREKEKAELERLMRRFHEGMAPFGDAPRRLEEALRRAGCRE